MIPSRNAQWVLPGSPGRYRVVWWHDDAARDTRRHLSMVAILGLLDGWMISRKLALQEIFEALSGYLPRRPSAAGRDGYKEQIKEQLANAFRTGLMVVLEADDVRTLNIEWAEELIQQLQPGISILVTGEDLAPQSHSLELLRRTQGLAQLTLSGLSRARRFTLTARSVSHELVLLRDQLLGEPLVWEHTLDELVAPQEEPDPGGDGVAGIYMPDNALVEQGTGEVLEV